MLAGWPPGGCAASEYCAKEQRDNQREGAVMKWSLGGFAAAVHGSQPADVFVSRVSWCPSRLWNCEPDLESQF